MRLAPLVAAVAVLAACEGHAVPHAGPTTTASASPTSQCGGRMSCPYRPEVYVNASSTIDGRKATFRPVTRVALRQPHHVVITVHFLTHNAPVTSWRLAEGGNGNFPKNPLVLARGTSLEEGQVITVDWKPRLTGDRSLVMDIRAGRDGLDTSAADVQVFGGTTLRVTSDCVHPAVKPRSIVVACGDGAERLAGVRYDTWDRTAAYGTATVLANDFTPDRAHGHDRPYPAHIRLSGVREFPEGPRYTVLRITFDGPTPYGQRVETTPV